MRAATDLQRKTFLHMPVSHSPVHSGERKHHLEDNHDVTSALGG